MKKILLLLFLIAHTSLAQVEVSPTDENLLYTGRVEFTNPENPVFSLNGVSIKFNFKGTSVSAYFSATKKSYLYVIIDGNNDPFNRKVIEVSGSNRQSFELASNLTDDSHSIEIVKLDESDSKVKFYGLLLEGEGLEMKPDRPELKLLFIGDSNTSGWNAWNAYDTGGGEASDGYFTFPGLVSRMLNAEYSLIGGGGSGVTDKAWWNMTKVWDLIHLNEPRTPSNEWKFGSGYWEFEPEAIVVNLGANDYYGNASKTLIKSSWKSFISEDLRIRFPNAHIVLANSYGWAYNEPADYVHEAIDELKTEGELNVSFVRLPWLWGQHHAVVNEHAGFANLIAMHLMEKLSLEPFEPTSLSSFVEKGTLGNGSFEKNVLPGIPDGWRPHGTIELVDDADAAVDGDFYMKCINGGWINFATEVNTGMDLLLTGWGRSVNESHTGFFKIVFKDQAQSTISSRQIQPNFTTKWQEFNVSAIVPENAWSAWIVLEAANGSTILFDNVSLTKSDPLGLNDEGSQLFSIYPNPASTALTISAESDLEINIYTLNGTLVSTGNEPGTISIRALLPGIYFVTDVNKKQTIRFVKY